MKKEEEMHFWESGNEGAFTVLELIFSEQMQFKTFIYRVVENSAGYRICNYFSQNVNL
jgi:hypothetical protein